MLSICTIYKEEELNRNFDDFVNSLPQDVPCELILMKTRENVDMLERCELIETTTAGNITIKHYDFKMRSFSFAKARNECHKYIDEKGIWTIALDIDERLYLQAEEKQQLLGDLIPSYVGLITVQVSNMSLVDGVWTGWGAALNRIYRSHKGFFWVGSSHEQIGASVELYHFEKMSSTINIKHLGYQGDINNFKHKNLRNIRLMAKDVYTKDVYNILPKSFADKFYDYQLRKLRYEIGDYYGEFDHERTSKSLLKSNEQ